MIPYTPIANYDSSELLQFTVLFGTGGGSPGGGSGGPKKKPGKKKPTKPKK
ncbi:MAG TPA: hypothetical protein VFS77_24265 [Pyrinomonadaceae bacterium]|nr:hypothetical protein [Pyrinomonadaceae bacterium]